MICRTPASPGTDGDHGGKVPPWEEDDGIYGIMSRIVRNNESNFIWSVRRDTLDLRGLRKDQIINHYGKAGSFTTKVLFLSLLDSLP
ncbi:Tubulin monoglycylase TTLL3 [Lamellibrachia satsuma]|nr:Tubulin monoglycylase TTLL3 [Lamellibrachia satsuma]